MIPRHRPPFSMAALANSTIAGFGPHRVEELEQAYAETLNVPHAIWLPSARYGICNALNFGLDLQDRVYCPGFTCNVVHQAIRRSGREMVLVDCSDNGLLMDAQILQQPSVHCRAAGTAGSPKTTGYGAVLSEVFGYRYQKTAEQRLLHDARLRVFDMAMCIPSAEDMQRLIDRDVALLSFGLGKPLYAGWGGMAFTKDDRMAAYLRSQRLQDIRRNSMVNQLLQVATVWMRTLAHSSWLYKLSRRTAETRSSGSVGCRLPAEELLTSEWWQSPTAFQVKLAQENLRQSVSFRCDRVEYGHLYRAELAHLTHEAAEGRPGWLTLMPDSPDAMSHFCIRLHPSVRDPLRKHLWFHGVDTVTLFPFPEGTEPAQLQNAFLLTQQILGLPLSNNLGTDNVRRICSIITKFAATHQVSGDQPLSLPASRCAA